MDLTVTQGLVARLTDPPLNIPATLYFMSGNPFTVTINFHLLDGDTTWIMSRELFEAVLRGEPAGHEGADASLTRIGSDFIQVRLSSPEGRRDILFPHSPVSSFMYQVNKIMPLAKAVEKITDACDAFLKELLE